MLQSSINRLLAVPRLHDLAQLLAGRRACLRALEPWVGELRGVVLDVAGGTGQAKALLPQTRHVCFDLEHAKLKRYSQAFATGIAVQGTALDLPFRSGSAQNLLFVGAFHHFDDAALQRVVAELRRVVAPGGSLVTLDAVTTPRTLSRWLWRYDQGAYPRSIDSLRRTVCRHFTVVEEKQFTVWHHYWVCRCRPA